MTNTRTIDVDDVKPEANEFIHKKGVSAWDDIGDEDDAAWIKSMQTFQEDMKKAKRKHKPYQKRVV